MKHTYTELSRDIDICHWQIDQLSNKTGLLAAIERAFWRWRLRRLERHIPKTPAARRGGGA